MSLEYYGLSDDEDPATLQQQQLPSPPSASVAAVRSYSGAEERHVLTTRSGPVVSMIYKGDRSSYGVVIGHPHPLMGGSMNNNVVMAIAGALQMRGISTVRFDFKHLDNCAPDDVDTLAKGHVPDLLAAHKALCAIVPRVYWCGYSYSSMIMAAAADDVSIAQTVGMRCYVSPPNKMMDADWYTNCADSPVRIIAGSLDTYFQGEGSDEVEIVDGADHFWHGHEELLGQRVADIFEQAHSASRM